MQLSRGDVGGGGPGRGARRRAVGLALAAGATGALCWLPTGLAPLMPLCFFFMARALRGATRRDAVWIGAAFGVSMYAVASHFLLALLQYSWLAVAFYGAAIASIVPSTILEAWGAVALEERAGLPRGIGFGVLYVLLEKSRTLTELAFPADLFSHAYGAAPAGLGWAPWIGPFGVVAFLALTGALLERAFENRASLRVAGPSALASLALWIAPFLAPADTATRPASGGPTLRVALVQPDVAVEDKLDRARWPFVWERLEDLTRQAARGADVVLWPETARPGFVEVRNDRAIDPEVGALAKEIGVPILYGTLLAETDAEHTVTALYNGAALARPDGTVSDWYGKRALLPFAEAVPYGRWVGLDPRQRARGGPRQSALSFLGNFTPGPRPTVFTVKNAKIGVLICFEGQFPNRARELRDAGANVLAVLTNDGWWGRSAFPAWHARMVAARARELGVPVVRAANSGISSVTDARGRTTDETRLFRATTVTVPVIAGGEPTFYAVHGDIVIRFLLLVIAWSLVRAYAFPPDPAGNGAREPAALPEAVAALEAKGPLAPELDGVDGAG